MDICEENTYEGCEQGDFMKKDAQISIPFIGNYLMTQEIEKKLKK